MGRAGGIELGVVEGWGACVRRWGLVTRPAREERLLFVCADRGEEEQW